MICGIAGNNIINQLHQTPEGLFHFSHSIAAWLMSKTLASKLDIQPDYGTIFGLEENKMNITNDIKPVTYLKSRAADLLNQINETHRPVIITQNGEPRAVLQDPKSYENMRNAIGILKLISEGESNIRGGRVKAQEDVFNDIEKGLKANSK